LKSIDNSLTSYRVNEYTKILFDFIWRDFCDWYVEIMKVQLNGSASKEYSKALISFAIDIYESILKILHPIMPFITEEIWHLLDDRSDTESISLQAYPEANESLIDADLEEEFEVLQMMIEEIRRQRSEKGIPPNQKTEAIISCSDRRRKEFLETELKSIETLAKCSKVEIGMNLPKPENSTASVVRDTEIFILLDQAMDMDKEKARLQKEIERLERNIAGAEGKLNNEGFVAKAPENIILFEREKLASMKDALEKVKGNLVDLK
jgi:valyl-tRNA synthetase